MKKSIILAAIALSFGLTACNQQKKVKAEMPTAEMQEEPVDTAFMQANAGEYKSYDGGKSITLKADGTVECKNTKYNYDSWGVMEKNESQASCRLSRKGIDRPISAHSWIPMNIPLLLTMKRSEKQSKRKRNKSETEGQTAENNGVLSANGQTRRLLRSSNEIC